MKVKFIFPVWILGDELKYWDLYSDKFLNYFFRDNFDKYDKIVYFHPSEPARLIEDPPFFQKLETLGREAGVKLDFVLGNYQQNESKNIINWWSYWQMAGYHYYKNFHFKSQVTSFDKTYICLNRRARLHRCLLMDELAKNNLIDKGYVSWHNKTNADGNKPHFNYPFKYFDGKSRYLDDLYDNITTPWQQEGYSILGDFYYKGFLNVISETTFEDIPYISEKTAYATLHEKPYLLLGCPKIHKKQTDLGYVLYDEIFDYSFDESPILENRIHGLVANIKSLENSNLNAIYEKILPKIKHNKDNFMKIIRNRDNIPPEIFAYEEYLTEPKDKEYYSHYKKIIDLCLSS